MNIQKTKAWKAAEWRYGEIHALSGVSLFGTQSSPEEIIERLEGVTKECPKFYPALLDSGLRRLATEDNEGAEQRIKKGFHLMLELSEPRHLDEEIEILLDNMEKLWRFDLCRYCLEFLVKQYPDKALFHDYLAYAAARMGDIETAMDYNARAVEMEPDNPHFRSNLGWIHLVAGNPKEAGEVLAAALRLAPDNEVTKGNLKIHQYLTGHGGNYFNYLLRPVEREEIDRLANEKEWEEVDAMCVLYNKCRIEALAQTLLQRDEDSRSHLPDMLATLEEFFRFVNRVNQAGYLLHEDISFIREHFKPIMHKFIFKFKDIDRKMIEEIYDSLFEYYGFLARENLVPNKEFKQFKKEIRGIKKELINKMQRYNTLRHNSKIAEEEKEDIREELFESDHAWPFI